jgi:hypothetical protein
MDNRAGAIIEATDADADLEHVRHAATHSDMAMTQRYSRGAEDKIASVQIARIAAGTRREQAKPKRKANHMGDTRDTRIKIIGLTGSYS